MSQANAVKTIFSRADLTYLFQHVEHVFDKNEQGQLELQSSFCIGEVTDRDGNVLDGEFVVVLEAEAVAPLEEGHELIEGEKVVATPLNRIFLMTQAINQTLEKIEERLIEVGATHIDGQQIELVYVGVAEE